MFVICEEYEEISMMQDLAKSNSCTKQFQATLDTRT